MSNVKRYSPGITMTSEVGLPGYYAPVLTLDEHGPAVMHDDYDALKAKADRLADALTKMLIPCGCGTETGHCFRDAGIARDALAANMKGEK